MTWLTGALSVQFLDLNIIGIDIEFWLSDLDNYLQVGIWLKKYLGLKIQVYGPHLILLPRKFPKKFNPAIKSKLSKWKAVIIYLYLSLTYLLICCLSVVFIDYTEYKKESKTKFKVISFTLFFKFYYFHTQLQAYHKHREKKCPL